MAEPIIAPDRAQYTPALQKGFLRGIDPLTPNRRLFPAGFTADHLNILDPKALVFTPWTLLSWGQFIRSSGVLPAVVTNRDRAATKIVADSGGFQFIDNPTLYQGTTTCQQYVGWFQTHCDVAMNMDIPTRAIGKGRWHNFGDCLSDTLVNLQTINASRDPDRAKLLNVIQGDSWKECLAWFDAVKVHQTEGWAFGGGSRELSIMLRLVARMLTEGRIGSHIHVLGRSSIGAAVELSALKAALAGAGHPVEITFDTASPNHMAANGRVYTGMNWNDRWASGQRRLELDPRLGGSTVPFPYDTTVVGGKVTMGDLLVRSGMFDQRGDDVVGHLLLVHHNIEQLLRDIRSANNAADLFDYPPPDDANYAPQKLVQRVRTIRRFLVSKDPGRAAQSGLRGLLEPLDEEDRLADA